MSSYAMDQERCFEKMMEALEKSQSQGAQLLDVDAEVEAFVNGIVYSLQKTSGQQHEKLFINICQLVYNSLFPYRQTAPRPTRPQTGAEPHISAFRPPCPVSTPSVPSAHGDQNQFGNHTWVPTSQMDGEGQGEYLCTLHFSDI